MKRAPLAVGIALALGLLAAVSPGHAQSKMPHLGILLTGSSSSAAQAPQLDALMKSLNELGWIEGQNLAVDRRWAERPEQLTDLAAALAQSSVSVILALGPEATRAAAAATPTTPVVMIASTDPRQVGASSLARPGANLTGLAVGQVEVFVEKQLDLLKAAIPELARVIVVWDVNRLRDGANSSAVMAGPPPGRFPCSSSTLTSGGSRISRARSRPPGALGRAPCSSSRARGPSRIVASSPSSR